MHYFKRKAVLTRLALFAGITVLLFGVFALSFAGGRIRLNAARRLADVNDASGKLAVRAMQIQSECRMAMVRPEVTDADMLKALLTRLTEQAQEAGNDLAKEGAAIGIRDEAADIRSALKKLKQAAYDLISAKDLDNEALADIIQESSTLSYVTNDMQEEAEGVCAERDRNGNRLIWLAGACLLLALSIGLFSGTMIALDIINEAMGALDLETVLKSVESKDVFRLRMRKLVPPEDPAQPEAPWGLRVSRVVREQRTHTTFEAMAERGSEKVLLWGKCYRWAGILKGAQRLIWRGYARGTWRAINVLHNRRLNSPFPVVFVPLKRWGMTIGFVLLTEFVRGTISVPKFLSANLPVMSPADRRIFLARMLEYWNRLHECGIHSMTFKCLYVKEASVGDVARAEFYLFDLDKTCVSSAPKGLACRIAVRRDNRHILHSLQEYLTPEEIELAEAALAGSAAPSDSAL